MTTPNPATATTKAEKITAYEGILTALYQALHDKAGRGSVTVGEVNYTFSSYEQIQGMIDEYQLKLNRLKNPTKTGIICR